MRRLYIVAAIAAFMALGSVESSASTKELESAVYKVIPVDGGFYVSLNTRKAYVNAMLVYWNDFNSRVPRLSPSEINWIEQETSAQGDRLTRVINSHEYALFSLSRDIDNCVSSLVKLNAGYENSAQAEYEMFLWLGMAKCYSKIDGMMANLQRAVLSDGRFDGAFYALGSSLIMDALLGKVIPSAMSDTMKWTISANK